MSKVSKAELKTAPSGRLAAPPGFTPNAWRGLATRERRLYLLQSLACQPNADRGRATTLLLRLALRTIATGATPRVAAVGRAECPHSRFFYEDCERCIQEYATQILALATKE